MSESDEISCKEMNQMIQDQSKQLREAFSLMTETLDNVYGLISDLGKYSEQVAESKADGITVKDLGMEVANSIDDICTEMMRQTSSLKETVRIQDAKLEEVQATTDKLDNEIKENSRTTAIMGRILGFMVWKTAKVEGVIDVYVKEDMITEFLGLAKLAIDGFMTTYHDELPNEESHEYKFAVSIFGIAVNLSGQKRSRDFILNHEAGLAFINQTLQNLPQFPMPSGHLIKRMCLMFVYNFAICKIGADVINHSECGVKNLLDSLASRNPPEIQQLVLELLTTMLDEITTTQFKQDIKQKISGDHLQQLMSSKDDDVKLSFKKFYDRVNQASID